MAAYAKTADVEAGFRALDAEEQNRCSALLTEAGVLVTCPGCGGDDTQECYVGGGHFVDCQTCGWAGPVKNSGIDARLAWNTRAPILSSREMEMLEGME